MSISKIQANALGLTQETTVALASLNFDFSLFKVEAPAEFKTFGNELTSTRKKAAEDGTPHITARKLGALFHHLVPPTPELIQAYGKRVTEIASSRAVNPKGSRAHGLFAEHVGIDGTSIWAAATSGASAIAVHFLACMLARMWSVKEAISIWTDIIIHRKNELNAIGDTEPLYLDAVSASQITVSREQLAEWDASARAWLRASDEAMSFKQKQLMLILNNIGLPVNKKPTVYHSVIDAWKGSLHAMDSLVRGLPQSIQDGSILLGLSSWHLYPELLVLGDCNTDVKFKDELIAPGGLLTIGLNVKSRGSGVYWSLPLSHMRYYGKPVVSERSLERQANRITFQQLLLVVLGSFSRSWGLSNIEIAQLTSQLWEVASVHEKRFCSNDTKHWLGLLAWASDEFLQGDALSKKQSEQLMRFGSKRCPDFIVNLSREPLPAMAFGLFDYTNFVKLLTMDGHIGLLRGIAFRAAINFGGQFVIRYRHSESETWSYATGLPLRRLASKRDVTGEPQRAEGHVRWLQNDALWDMPRLQNIGEMVVALEEEPENIRLSITPDPADRTNAFIWTEHESNGASLTLNTGGVNDHMGDFVHGLGSEAKTITFNRIWPKEEADVELCWSPQEPGTHLQNVGIQNTCQLLLSDILKILERGHVDGNSLMKHLVAYAAKGMSRMISLKALSTISNIYALLPDATIGLEVTSQPLYSMNWIPEPPYKERKFSKFTMDWQRTFSCIALFESGSFDVPPETLDRVMALSVGDSLYVAAPLLCDPIEEPLPHEISHIRGNIGKPGIAMLIPPGEPQMEDFDPYNYKLVTHAPYDGLVENSFDSTTLHLSFTGYTLPIEGSGKGFKDTEIYFLETRVTVHDRGEEIGDLDILGYFCRHPFVRVPACHHSPSPGQSASFDEFQTSDISAIDNWAELLDGPDGVAIARSAYNWLGRLSLTTVCIQLGYKPMILQNNFCWGCTRQAYHRRGALVQSQSVSESASPSALDESYSSSSQSLLSTSINRQTNEPDGDDKEDFIPSFDWYGYENPNLDDGRDVTEEEEAGHNLRSWIAAEPIEDRNQCENDDKTVLSHMKDDKVVLIC